MAPFLKAGVFFINTKFCWPELRFFILNCTHLGTSHNKDLWNANKFYSILFNVVKVKVTFTLEQATKAQRGKRYSSTLLNLGTRLAWVVNATSRPIARWAGPTVSLDWWGKSGPHRDSIPGPSSP